MRIPEVIVSKDEDLGKRYSSVEIDTERIEDIIARNLQEEPIKDTLPIHFLNNHLADNKHMYTFGIYNSWRRSISVSLEPSASVDNRLDMDSRLLHELGHYVKKAAVPLGKIALQTAISPSALKILGGNLLVAVAAPAIAMSDQNLLAFSSEVASAGLAITGLGITALEVARLDGLGPAKFAQKNYEAYRNDPEEIFANEFAAREQAQLNEPIIKLTPLEQLG